MTPPNFCSLLLVAMTVLCTPHAWAAETYPVKPVRFLVGFSPGGANDLVARVVAAKLSPALGQQVVVDNRAGAGGNIAHDMLAKAPADGYTMVLASVSSLAMSPGLLSKMPYDPVRDFAPVAQVVNVTSLLSANLSSGSKSLKDFVARAKQQPGALNVGNPGRGSIAHLAFELFSVTAGIRVVNVPFKGGSPAAIGVISGQVGHMIGIISTGAAHVKSGKLRGLAVTSPKRSAILPDVPAFAEGGYPGFEASGWLGIAFPAQTPKAIVQRMYQAVRAVMAMPDVRQTLENSGLDPEVKDPAAFQALIKSDLAKWDKLIKDAGIKEQ